MRMSVGRLMRQAAGRRPRQLPSFTLPRAGRVRGVYLAGHEHERVEKLVVDRPLVKVLAEIQRYVRGTLWRWQKVDEVLVCSGPRIVVRYEHRYEEGHELEPKTWRAHWNAEREKERTRRGAIVKRVPYEVELRLDIEQRFAGPVLVEVRLAEKIDPRGHLSEFPIGHHFWAPSAIHTEPWFDELVALLRRHA